MNNLNKLHNKLYSFLILNLIINQFYANLKPDYIDRAKDYKAIDEIIIETTEKSDSNSINIKNINHLNNILSKVLNLNLSFKQNLSSNHLVFKINENNNLTNNKIIRNKIKNLDKNFFQQENIMNISPNIHLKTQMEPNDSRYSEQWNYFESDAGINMPNAWDLSTGDKDTVIAVLDTGITNHENLKNKILPGKNFVQDRDDPNNFWDDGIGTEYHGTHVAGIIAANGNMLNEISGIDWHAKILPIRVLGNDGIGDLVSLIQGIRYAIGEDDNNNPAKIINLSLGSYEECPDILQKEINNAVDKYNVTFVVAAGNSGVDAKLMTPANCNNVITVAAINRNGFQTYYTNYGSDTVDIAAPGGEQYNYYMSDGILSTTSPGNFKYMQGTSMAAPHVAGVVALINAINPDFSANEIKKIIKNSSKGNVMQVGILDAKSALEYSKLLSFQVNTKKIKLDRI